jgi:hypothetical protein
VGPEMATAAGEDEGGTWGLESSKRWGRWGGEAKTDPGGS